MRRETLQLPVSCELLLLLQPRVEVPGGGIPVAVDDGPLSLATETQAGPLKHYRSNIVSNQLILELSFTEMACKT